MKKLIILLSILGAVLATRAQTPVQVTQAQQFNKFIRTMDSLVAKGAVYLKNVPIGTGTGRAVIGSDGKIYKDTTTINANTTIIGFTVTSLPTIGQVVTTGTPANVLQQLYQQEQALPNASISGGNTYELTSASTANGVLSYSYSKNTGNTNFASATINGSSTGVTFNANGASGTYSATWNTNTTTTYTLSVTTVGGKNKTAITTVSYLPLRYYGYSAGPVPTNSEILAAAGGGSSLTNSKAGTFTVTPSGSKYPFVAYVSTSGDLSSISIGGAPYSWTKNVISVTNVNSYTQNYNVYVDPVPTSGALTFTTN